jgi:hypothetical protein
MNNSKYMELTKAAEVVIENKADYEDIIYIIGSGCINADDTINENTDKSDNDWAKVFTDTISENLAYNSYSPFVVAFFEAHGIAF